MFDQFIKSKVLLITATMWAIGFGESGAFAGDLSGTIEIKNSNPIVLKDTSGKEFQLGNGPLSFSVEKKGWFFDSSMTISASDGHKIEFKVPRKSYADDGESFDVPADKSGQGYELIGKYEEKEVRAWRELGTNSCSYTGYCFGCLALVPDGKGGMTTGCGFGVQLCSDNQDVIWQRQSVERRYVVDLIDPKTKTVLAQVSQGTPTPKQVDKVEKLLSACAQGRGEHKVLSDAAEGAASTLPRLAYALEAPTEGDRRVYVGQAKATNANGLNDDGVSSTNSNAASAAL